MDGERDSVAKQDDRVCCPVRASKVDDFVIRATDFGSVLGKKILRSSWGEVEQVQALR